VEELVELAQFDYRFDQYAIMYTMIISTVLIPICVIEFDEFCDMLDRLLNFIWLKYNSNNIQDTVIFSPSDSLFKADNFDPIRIHSKLINTKVENARLLCIFPYCDDTVLGLLNMTMSSTLN
jgi:hypothetical protein